jgi:small redox-active disulfide protein 2
MKIEVLGTGCTKCNKLYEATKEAVQRSGVSAEITKVDDLAQIMKYRVLVTPALVVDGKVVVSGKVPSPEEIGKFLK